MFIDDVVVNAPEIVAPEIVAPEIAALEVADSTLASCAIAPPNDEASHIELAEIVIIESFFKDIVRIMYSCTANEQATFRSQVLTTRYWP